METSVHARQEMRCNICAKTFDNRKSQLRHASYCRRAKTRVRSRKKACGACTSAKARCDLTQPNCSRCVTKNLGCNYEPLSKAQSTSNLPGKPSDQMPEHFSLTNSTSNSSHPTQLVARGRYPATTSSLNSHGFGPEEIDISGIDWWNSGFLNLMQSETLPWVDTTETASTNYIEYFGSTTDLPEYSSMSSAQFTSDEEVQHSTNGSSDGLNSPTKWRCTSSISIDEFEHILPNTPKVFSARKPPSGSMSLSRKYVLSTLRSYPYRILSPSPPPFLHQENRRRGSQAGNLVTHGSQPASLEVCAAIVQMCSVKNKENTPFIWRTIQMEQQRFLAEHLNYNDRDAVAALQAITVYVLLRVAEDNEDATNFDIPLIDTMIKLSVQVSKGRVMDYDNPAIGIPSWEDWILAESLRRTIILLCLVDFLFDYSSAIRAYKCDGSLLAGLTLPCGRDMWRASTRAEWEKAYIAERAIGRKRLTYGDLLNFHLRAEGTLDHWLSQLDDFGTLIMQMAAGNL